MKGLISLLLLPLSLGQGFGNGTGIFLVGFNLCSMPKISDGNCDKNCMVPSNFYDGRPFEDITTSDCFLQCLTFGCSKDLLFNEACDEVCNHFECGWDNGSCGYCRKNCTTELLLNEVCDPECSYLVAFVQTDAMIRI